MCLQREPTGQNLTLKGLPNPLNPSEITAEAASQRCSLKDLAKKSNDVSVARRLYVDLLKEGIGTSRIEREAYNNLRDQKGTNNLAKMGGKINALRIREERDPRIVKDFLEMKVKQLEREEKEVKREYRVLKERTRVSLKTSNKERIFKKLMRQIQRSTVKNWENGLKDNVKKDKFLKSKFGPKSHHIKECKCREVYMKMCQTRGEQESFEHWVQRMSKGSEARKRLRRETPVYDNL